MGNLAYIEEMGIGSPEVDDTEVETKIPEEQSKEDLSLDSEVNDSEESEEGNTEPNSEYLESLKKQIEGMEKRIADKDAYINELREASKQKEVEKDQQVDTDDEEDDFWNDPESVVKKLKSELREQKEIAKIQQLQIQEAVYANTVKDYWGTVNPEALKNAVATDTEFSENFNKSKEPYKFAYEYLSAKKAERTKSEESLRDKIRKELIAEMGVKPKKEAPPTISAGSSAYSRKEVSADGFASVFGSEY